MKRDTPRTYKESYSVEVRDYELCEVVDAEFARVLERELNIANKRVKVLRKAIENLLASAQTLYSGGDIDTPNLHDTIIQTRNILKTYNE
jgi:hypothetical protein